MSAIPRPVIIVLLLAMAAVAVARNVLFFAGSGGDVVTGSGGTMEEAEIVPIIAVQDGEVPGPKLSPEQRFAALRAADGFTEDLTTVRDPFHLPLAAAAPPSRRPAARHRPPAGPDLRIVLTSSRRQVAMVDDQIVSPGDLFAGRRVAEITADGMRLVGADGETRIELPPRSTDQESDAQR